MQNKYLFLENKISSFAAPYQSQKSTSLTDPPSNPLKKRLHNNKIKNNTETFYEQ
jgi:hypothetical protein